MNKAVSESLICLARELSEKLRTVAQGLRRQGIYVYDPTEYAWQMHEDYLRKYASDEAPVVMVGMNPGPWGMAQTGVPFGAVNWVKDWLKVKGPINQPAKCHPARPVLGMDCERVEVSGDRMWGMLCDLFGTTKKMRRNLLVLNYCPLLLLESSGKGCRNLPLNKVSDAQLLLRICDDNLAAMLDVIKPHTAIGVGAWATERLRKVASKDMVVGQILHPSPASPLANRGFAPQAIAQLNELGVA